ncbi:unnamed protein product [Kluyveromyces dobzhanskii CBS 2104]|uniref:WGS project CCBQ000000000 data, contig 00015 n=1 Tax=Kluyveromyces dobzhanskii CBS 2104 TaxID=1427455 RepID=A0A0A8LBY6_9SACH|nr:unnamed protein product [Kluyveromyces dobzhanskii CBS 2104]
MMGQKRIQLADTKRLEQLLDDERFRLNLQPVDTEKSHEQECLDLYVKGDLKDCLERMYEHGLLNGDKLQTSLKSWQLMMDCLGQMNCVTVIGTSLDKCLKTWFTSESSLQQLIKTKPLSEKLTITYQFFHASLQFWRRNVKQHYEHIDELSISCKELILQTSRRCHTATEVQNLSRILELLIFDVQIGTLQKKASLTMYTRFCQLDDQLETKFKSILIEPTQSLDIDTYFRQRIQPKATAKPKLKSKPKNKSQNRPTKPKPKSQPALQPAADTNSQATNTAIAPTGQTLSIPNLRHLTRYIPRWLPVWARSVHWSPQLLASIIIFIVSIVLPIARRSKTFRIIWTHGKDRVSTITKVFVSTMNTLASL